MSRRLSCLLNLWTTARPALARPPTARAATRATAARDAPGRRTRNPPKHRRSVAPGAGNVDAVADRHRARAAETERGHAPRRSEPRRGIGVTDAICVGQIAHRPGRRTRAPGHARPTTAAT